LFVASKRGHYDIVKCLLSYGADINCKLISASELSKHLTTSQCPRFDAAHNGDCPPSSHKLISAPALRMLLNVYLVLMQISICVMKVDNHHCVQHQSMDTVMLLNVYLVLVQISIDVTNKDNHHCL
jgi:hypothetical protein